MKMAKASEADLETAMELANALEALNSQWGATMPEKIARPQRDDETEWFSLDEEEHCRRVCEYLIRLTRSASLFRVVMGMAVLLDPENKLVDPNADTLEHHPDTATALATVGTIPTIQAEAAKSERRAITFGDIVAQQVSAMRAAVVDAELNGPAAGMVWIRNTLAGPGHLPDVRAAQAEGGAQSMFNREIAEHEAFRAAHPAP